MTRKNDLPTGATSRPPLPVHCTIHNSLFLSLSFSLSIITIITSIIVITTIIPAMCSEVERERERIIKIFFLQTSAINLPLKLLIINLKDIKIKFILGSERFDHRSLAIIRGEAC